jgi:hypothetical protein
LEEDNDDKHYPEVIVEEVKESLSFEKTKETHKLLIQEWNVINEKVVSKCKTVKMLREDMPEHTLITNRETKKIIVTEVRSHESS